MKEGAGRKLPGRGEQEGKKARWGSEAGRQESLVGGGGGAGRQQIRGGGERYM